MAAACRALSMGISNRSSSGPPYRHELSEGRLDRVAPVGRNVLAYGPDTRRNEETPWEARSEDVSASRSHDSSKCLGKSVSDSLIRRTERSASWDFERSSEYVREQGLHEHITFVSAKHWDKTLPLNSERHIFEIDNVVVRDLEIERVTYERGRGSKRRRCGVRKRLAFDRCLRSVLSKIAGHYSGHPIRTQFRPRGRRQH